jgi:membrane protease YdiL (CAAX protease family)
MSILRLILLATMMAVTVLSVGGDVRADVAALAQAAPPPTPTTPIPPPPTATQPAGADDAASLALTVVAGLVLIALAAPGIFLTGAYRRDSIRGPLRLAPRSPVLPILLILIIGGGCWLGGQMLFFVIRGVQHARATGGEQMTMQHLGAGDMALVATLPSLLALLVVLALDARFRLLASIGLRLTQLPRTLLIAFLSGVIALLLTYGASSLLGVFYKLIEYEHPSEHELLGAMKQASTAAKLMLVFGACIMAPLFEELLFRGHMQTLLTRLFTPRPPEPAPVMPPPPMPAMPMPMSAPAAMATPLTPSSASADVLPVPPLPPAFVTAPWPAPPSELSPIPYASPLAPADGAVGRWLAVIITSIVFAIIHPLWTAPMIFLLSLCLGYAYERTGSLWVPIIMHAMFNTSSTVMFLLLM